MAVESTFERNLSELLVRGGEEDLGEFVILAGPLVYSYLNRIGVSATDRDDIYQEVFIKVITNREKFDPNKRISAWLFTIAVNLTRSRFRARKDIYSIDDFEEPCSATADSFEKLIGKELQERIESILPILPLSQREAILICGFEQIDQKEAALILNIPEATLRTNLRRARIKLAQILSDLELKNQIRVVI